MAPSNQTAVGCLWNQDDSQWPKLPEGGGVWHITTGFKFGPVIAFFVWDDSREDLESMGVPTKNGGFPIWILRSCPDLVATWVQLRRSASDWSRGLPRWIENSIVRCEWELFSCQISMDTTQIQWWWLDMIGNSVIRIIGYLKRWKRVMNINGDNDSILIKVIAKLARNIKVRFGTIKLH